MTQIPPAQPCYSRHGTYPPPSLPRDWASSQPHHFSPYSHYLLDTHRLHNHPYHLNYITPPSSHSSTSTMTTPDPDEMEQFQRLSDQYQPDVAVGLQRGATGSVDI